MRMGYCMHNMVLCYQCSIFVLLKDLLLLISVEILIDTILTAAFL